jgi:hypothetical protein
VVKGAAAKAARCGKEIFKYLHEFLFVKISIEIFSDIYEYHKLQ